MPGIVSAFVAILITVPMIGYLAVFIISKQITGNHRRSVNLAIDFSTFLLVLSVHFLIVTIWGKSFLWLILVVLFGLAAFFVWIHWKYKEEIIMPKVFKGFWRFNFLLFFSAYIILVLFGLFQRLTLLFA
ncbi:DUF3397 domain-containing protein [Mesobacillus subterraneus]|uniref:DUF3397 domain-containing protein n=1 Tax=Mesobacillus subterraneus TaxID=285983 RepID=UPI00203D12E2|nr:DUF3397 domain-containing protein [Mesobacillus subterraneus]MCM3665738.1 DUF3397 domain-containing protein [Mesobacillus subterraneus]MCM3684483.1 DUF3397 domain-containing protein [Mesobacillus subterraneus]